MSANGDVRERTWLTQHISLAVVRGNAISIAMSHRCPFFAPRVMIILVLHKRKQINDNFKIKKMDHQVILLKYLEICCKLQLVDIFI